MKINFRILFFISVLTTSCFALPKQSERQPGSQSYQIFYDQLSPYGQWIEYKNYGYVWVPETNADVNFAPYSNNGHWESTVYGWTWISDYSWGWAVFHYGRWSFNDSFGWFWVPDSEWGPAWVNWREADGYYGWSPMAPDMNVYISLNMDYNPNNYWQFVEYRSFGRRNVSQYTVNRRECELLGEKSRIIRYTYIDNQRRATYPSGPSPEEVQVSSGRAVTRLSLRDNDRPGQEMSNGELKIYRPQISQDQNARKPAPARVTNSNEIRQRTSVNTTNENRQAEPLNKQDNKRNDNQRNDNQPVRRPVTEPQNDRSKPQNRIEAPVQEQKVRPTIPLPTPINNQETPNRQQNTTPARNETKPVKQRSLPEPRSSSVSSKSSRPKVIRNKIGSKQLKTQVAPSNLSGKRNSNEQIADTTQQHR